MSFIRFLQKRSDIPAGGLTELECNRALLTMALISGADVSMPTFKLQDDSFNIQRDVH